MDNVKSVLIPIPLVKQIIDLFGCWDNSMYDRAVRDDCRDVVRSLYVKMQKLELRVAYSKIVAADTEDRRHDARLEYLWQKSRLDDLINDGRIF